MMMRLLLLIITLNFTTYALEIKDHSHLLVHTNRYYHQQEQTVEYTKEILSHVSGDIIGLYQKEEDIDSKWYIPSHYVDKFVYSISGKHNLRVNPQVSSQTISLSGGYFTHCLARATTSTIANFIKTPNTKKLTIKLPSSSIFTGHQIVAGILAPKTAYQESILDDTIKGLNLSQVMDQMSSVASKRYLQDAFPIVFIKHAVMKDLKNYSIKLFYRKQMIREYKVGTNKKKINIYID